MGAAVCVCGLRAGMAVYRAGKYCSTLADNKYTLLGGVIGAFITITVIQSMGALGPAKAAMLIVISQLAVAYIIELLGIFGVDKQPFEWRKLLGMGIAIVGIIIFKWQK